MPHDAPAALTQIRHHVRAVSRRRALRLLGGGSAVLILAGCGPTTSQRPSVAERATATALPDFSARFAAFAPADEPNGDLSKLVWPDYVTQADPEVKRLYEFQITHGDLMRWMPCFCGCGQSAGHRSNRDCYVQTVHPDGSVVLDAMAPT